MAGEAVALGVALPAAVVAKLTELAAGLGVALPAELATPRAGVLV
jgi:hypothetical protein